MKKSNSKGSNCGKHVSFGESTVVEVEKIPQNEQRSVWYGRAELNDLLAAEVAEMKDCENKCWNKPLSSKCQDHTLRGLEAHVHEPSFSASHKHVRHVLKIYQNQLKEHGGRWDPYCLRRASKFASKNHRTVAVKRAKKDSAEVNDGMGGLVKAFFNRVMPRQA